MRLSGPLLYALQMLCEAGAGTERELPMCSKPGIGEKVNAPMKQIAGREVNKSEKDLAQCGNQVSGL